MTTKERVRVRAEHASDSARDSLSRVGAAPKRARESVPGLRRRREPAVERMIDRLWLIGTTPRRLRERVLYYRFRLHLVREHMADRAAGVAELPGRMLGNPARAGSGVERGVRAVPGYRRRLAAINVPRDPTQSPARGELRHTGRRRPRGAWWTPGGPGAGCRAQRRAPEPAANTHDARTPKPHAVWCAAQRCGATPGGRRNAGTGRRTRLPCPGPYGRSYSTTPAKPTASAEGGASRHSSPARLLCNQAPARLVPKPKLRADGRALRRREARRPSAAAAARPAVRPENRQPPRKVPSSER